MQVSVIVSLCGPAAPLRPIDGVPVGSKLLLNLEVDRGKHDIAGKVSK